MNAILPIEISGNSTYDVIVVGGGHAGCEAAAAAARIGARTLLLTHSAATIGAMSCNPAIGGVGKGHLVREVDALDGLMGRAADAAGIQFRLLNRSKGPAVRGPRAQSDRALYRTAIQELLANQAGLEVLEAEAEDLVIEAGRVAGVRCSSGAVLRCGAVVLTAGTFLRGVIHIGSKQIAAGRVGERPSVGLAQTLDAAHEMRQVGSRDLLRLGPQPLVVGWAKGPVLGQDLNIQGPLVRGSQDVLQTTLCQDLRVDGSH